MKKLLLILIAITVAVAGYSQNKGKRQHKPVKKRDAAIFLNKTNKIMHETAKIVKEYQVYTGGLVAAKDFQKKAIDEFNAGKYQACVNDSYTARRLSFRAYMKNKNQKPPQDWTLNNIERHFVTIQITPQKIDEILAKTDKNKESEIDLDDLDDVVVPDTDNDDNSKDKTTDDANENSKGKTN